MKFTIDKSTLMKNVQATLGILGGGAAVIPILHNILIRAGDGRIIVTGAGREASIVITGPADVTEPGSITIPAKKLNEALKSLDCETISFNCTGSEKAEVKCGRSSFKIAGLPEEDYPRIEDKEVRSALVSSEALNRLIGKTIFAASRQDHGSYALAAGYLHTERTEQGRVLTIAATDGYRLAVACAAPEDLEGDMDLDSGILIPKKSLAEVKKILNGPDEKVEIGVGESYFMVKKGNTTFRARTIEGQYPDYRKVFPKDTKTYAEVPAENLIRCLKRMNVVTNEKYSGVQLTISEGRMSLHSDNPDVGQADDQLDINYKGPEMEGIFNAALILELVEAAMSGPVQFAIHSEKPMFDLRQNCYRVVIVALKT